MRLFYDPNITPEQQMFQLSEEESKHICKVLRMNEGDAVGILNGKGEIFETKITIANPKRCEVSIISIEKFEQKEHLHLAIAPTKINDRMEWLVEKAVEIGVKEITFLYCNNAERKAIKIERFEAIAISAMKQSKRYFLPKINDLTKFETFVKNNPNGLIAHCYPAEKSTIKAEFSTSSPVILIGPEGDFSLQEVEIALENNYKAISLSDYRLRTETAGLMAVMETQML